jgi:N-acyl-D-aspartate/D-glutamate deacylase
MQNDLNPHRLGRLVVGLVVAAALWHTTGLAANAQKVISADWLLVGGTIYDGSGRPPVTGDVAIEGDRIVAVGKFVTGKVGKTVDCTGLVIAPGFIDLHNHSDSPILAEKTRANVNFVMQGCTTIVTGNCGFGSADVGKFYQQIDKQGAGTNVAHLLPQGALRNAILGTANRRPSGAELAAMRQLAEKAMREGAWGMSTGLIYVPSSYANVDELSEITKVVGRYEGVYVSHIRNENTQLLAAVQEALEIGRRGGTPVHISHFKSTGRDSWGVVRQAAKMIEKARKAGRRVTADQYPYIASSTSLDAILIEPWARAGGREALIKRFDDKTIMARLRYDMEVNLKKRNGPAAIKFVNYTKRPEWIGKSLAEVAKSEKRDPIDVAIEITRNGGASIVSFSMSEDDVRHVMQIPWVATASDGKAYLPGTDKPHPRNYGTFPRKIGYYSIREKVLPLSKAIRSATGLPADILGIPQRGYAKAGFFADVVVFDAKKFIDAATFDDPHQYAQGVKYVFVNGTPVVDDFKPTRKLSGRALKHVATDEKPSRK